MKPPRRRLIVALARAAVTVVILTVLFVVLPRDEIVAAIRRIAPLVWILVLIGFLFGHAVSAMKWRMLLSVCGIHVPAVTAFRAHAAGLFANLCLPSLVGGDVIRAGLATRAGGKLESVVVGTAADRIIDTAALLGLVTAATLTLPDALGDVTGRVIMLASIALLVACAVGAALVLLLDPERLPSGFPAKLRAPVGRVRDAIAGLAKNPGHTVLAALLALGVQSTFVLLNARLGHAVGLELPLAVWFFVWPLAKLSALVPLSLGGIGVREAALAALVLPFGTEPSLAVAQSLVWETVLIAGGLVAGAWVLWTREAPAGKDSAA